MPFDAEDRRGIVYVWIGSKADPEEATVAEEIAYSLYDTESFIADVGGYMGLLLGCSLLSLYKEVEGFLKKLFCKPQGGKKISISRI